MNATEALRRQLLTQDLAEQLDAPVEYDDQAETIAPCDWIVTVEDRAGGFGVAVITIKEALEAQQLAGTFSELTVDRGAVRGHARSTVNQETLIFFANDGDTRALAAYVKAYQGMKQGKGKGFG